MTLSVGLVGFGLAGRVLHTPLILSAGMRITAVVTSQVAAVNSTLPNALVVDSIDALPAIAPLDVVIITTPNELHMPQALLALQAGKHVVIDKPMALSVTEAELLIQAARQANRSLTVFHNRRWDSDFLTVQKLIKEDALGEITQFEAHWDRLRPEVVDRWRERDQLGSGMLYDLGSHLIDQTLCLFGMPEWLQADVYQQRKLAVCDDAFEIRMAYGTMRVILSVNSLANDPSPRFRLHGSVGTYTKHGLDMQESQLRAGMTPEHGDFGIESADQWGKLTISGRPDVRIESQRGHWLAFYENLVANIELGQPLAVKPQQAVDGLRIIEAARESSEHGRRVVI